MSVRVGVRAKEGGGRGRQKERREGERQRELPDKLWGNK